MEMDKFTELEKAAEPLRIYLNEHYDPHAIVIVSFGRVEVLRGEIATNLKVED